MIEFSDQVVVVTGAGAGIGRVSAQTFAEHGATVAAIDINADTAEQTVQTIEESGGQAISIQADVGVGSSVDAAFKTIESRLGKVNALVNVAGIELYKSFLDYTDDEWDRQLAVNLKSVFLCSRRAIPFMLRGGGGSIVNTASCLAFGSVGRISPYAASKAGIIGMMRDMAHEFGKDGIRINTICPGVVNTPMLNRSFGTEEERAAAFARIEEALPLRRIGEPIDYANLAMFLASPMSSYITGQWIAVDGGMMCRLPLT